MNNIDKKNDVTIAVCGVKRAREAGQESEKCLLETLPNFYRAKKVLVTPFEKQRFFISLENFSHMKELEVFNASVNEGGVKIGASKYSLRKIIFNHSSMVYFPTEVQYVGVIKVSDCIGPFQLPALTYDAGITPALEKLVIRSCKRVALDMGRLERASRLRTVKIENCDHVSGLETIGALKDVEEIHLRRCKLDLEKNLVFPSKLRSLNLKFTEVISHEKTIHLQSLPKLRQLSISAKFLWECVRNSVCFPELVSLFASGSDLDQPYEPSDEDVRCLQMWFDAHPKLRELEVYAGSGQAKLNFQKMINLETLTIFLDYSDVDLTWMNGHPSLKKVRVRSPGGGTIFPDFQSISTLNAVEIVTLHPVHIPNGILSHPSIQTIKIGSTGTFYLPVRTPATSCIRSIEFENVEFCGKLDSLASIPSVERICLLNCPGAEELSFPDDIAAKFRIEQNDILKAMTEKSKQQRRALIVSK